MACRGASLRGYGRLGNQKRTGCIACPDDCRRHTLRYKFIGASIPGGLAIGDHAGHRYLGPIHPASARREIARATSLVSAAETEVQPLTVIESILAGRPALLSDIPAHRILAREFPNAFLFDRRDPTSFAMGWHRMQASLLGRESALSGRAIAKKRYGGDAFEGRLADLLRSLHAGTDGIPALQA